MVIVGIVHRDYGKGWAGGVNEWGGGVANEKNLIPNEQRTPSERRKNAQKAGKASGASRRRRKSLKEAADLYLSLPVSGKRELDRLTKKGVDPEDVDNQMAIIIGLADAAACGDARAAKLIIDLIGDESDGKNKEGAKVIIDV